MNKNLIFLALLLLGSIGYSQSLDCNKFKNGKFYNTNYPSSYFVIKDTIMEDFGKEDLVWAWSIKWLNDCEYEAICTKTTGDFINVGDKMTVTITSIEDNCFYFNRKLIDKTFGDGSDTKSFYSCIAKGE